MSSEPGTPAPAPAPARARSPSRSRRLRRATAVALAFAVPVAVGAWLVADELTARERRLADARVLRVLDRARTELDAALAASGADARSLARAAEVRLAVIRGDTGAVARLARTFPGLVVTARGRMLTRPPPVIAHVETVRVKSRGRVVGSIGIATPLDRRLLLRVHADVPVPMLFEHRGRVVAGVGVDGTRVALSDSGPAHVTLGGVDFRAAATPVDGTGARLAVLEPAELGRRAEDRRIRGVVLAAVLVLMILALAADVISAIARRRRDV